MSVGPRARLPEILPRLRALAGRHVVTVERVRVVRRMWHRVMVFCGEPARWEGHPLYTRLIRRLREAEAAARPPCAAPAVTRTTVRATATGSWHCAAGRRSS